ncbi:MAG: alpha/beta hydrolase [Ruminiclostridium sp.]|nr:alpha/beta hydrolase [Ruminiclostridium sp.]
MEISVKGIPVHYAENGDGGAALVLQGWGTSINLYDPIIDTLAEKYHVYAPDLPGFGETLEPDEPWDVDGYADFVLAFCEKLGITEAFVFAHSFGARVTLKLLARDNCPLTIKKIVLTGAAGIRHEPSEEAKKKAAKYQRAKKFYSSALIKTLFPKALENLRMKHGSADYRAASPMMRQVLVKTVNEDLTPLLPKCSAETLLIWGRDDDATPLEDGQRMEKDMPGAALVTIDNAGHFAFADQQYLFMRVLAAYIGLTL